MNQFRILVTGSRTWTDTWSIFHALDQAITWAPETDQAHLIHGGAEGADTIAAEWVDHYNARHPGAVTVECYPYPKGLGRRGGQVRNQYMVGLGADIVTAFLMPCVSTRCGRPELHPSHGAAGCADFAQKQGLTVWRFPR